MSAGCYEFQVQLQNTFAHRLHTAVSRWKSRSFSIFVVGVGYCQIARKFYEKI